MQPETYLRRIHYSGSHEPTAEVLRDLHRAHMLSVPFENLDIPAQRPIILETDLLLHKVVNLHRGGFCYELNGAFAWLLRSIGFEVMMLSAGVARKDGTFSPEFDHMALEVRDSRRDCWLVDVGFGDCFLEPLSFSCMADSQQLRWIYRLVEDKSVYWLSASLMSATGRRSTSSRALLINSKNSLPGATSIRPLRSRHSPRADCVRWRHSMAESLWRIKGSSPRRTGRRRKRKSLTRKNSGSCCWTDLG